MRNVTATVASPCANLASKKFLEGEKLNKAEEAEYKFLKREVDKWYDELQSA